MINETLKEMSTDCMISKEEGLYKNEDYVRAVREYSRLCNELRKYLPKENAVSILDELDIASGQISKMEKNFFYKEGFKDCMDIILNAIHGKGGKNNKVLGE